MNINVNYCDTFLNALTNTYIDGSYVRTFGFADVGDGGAAVYMVSQDLPDADKIISTTVAGENFTYGDGKFYKTNSTVFEFVSQGNAVYAEQFGVFPGDVAFAADNIKMLNQAVAYAAKNACVLTFASKGTYYVNPSSIIVPSGMHIDGNGATLQICEGSANSVGLFNSSTLVNDVSISNLNLVGRRTSASGSKDDQAIHIKCNNLTVKNVRFKCFDYALHTYGGDYVGTYIIQADEADTKTYMIPEIPNKNWLIENCTVSDVVMGVSFSEIDGLVIKDSDISCFMDGTNRNHCVYLSSNCSNVRVSNTLLHDVPGDAIHKAYSPPASNPKFDKSKNHFFTDLSIYNADSALDIGIVSQNVMCDNVFATEVKVILQLIGADNCIVSNSYFGQADNSSKSTTFIYAEDTCNCWMQNSYVKYNGNHRVASSDPPSAYIKDMYADKKHRRMYIGAEFIINSYAIKLTGCNIVSAFVGINGFFDTHMSGTEEKPVRTAVTEYWDNCTVNLNTKENLFRLKCTSDIHTGLKIRNCYFHNDYTYNKSKALFKLDCVNRICNCCTSDDCSWKNKNKRFPWVHMENVVLDNAGYWGSSSWAHIIAVPENNETYIFTLNDAVRISNSYATNCYKITNGQKTKMSNLMV